MGNHKWTRRLWSCWWDAYSNWRNLIYEHSLSTNVWTISGLWLLPNFQVPGWYMTHVARCVAVESCLARIHVNVWKKLRANTLILFNVCLFFYVPHWTKKSQNEAFRMLDTSSNT
jgi:hypothetical protein